MRNGKSYTFLITAVLSLAILISVFGIPLLAVNAAEDTVNTVTASMPSSVTQGSTGYCYVYIDSLESLSSLNVAVHYDPDKISVTSSYNQVACTMYDGVSGESYVQYAYIFDGNGTANKTSLFYFQYQILSDAPVGETYFDIVVTDAYDASLNVVEVAGSRTSFSIQKKTTNKSCTVSATSSVNTSITGEFEISYRLNTKEVASGSFKILYDAELLQVIDVTQGALLENKITDINTATKGAVYVSFVGTEYATGTQLLTVKFKPTQNVTATTQVQFEVTEFFDLQLNTISCKSYKTNVNIAYDPLMLPVLLTLPAPLHAPVLQ